MGITAAQMGGLQFGLSLGGAATSAIGAYSTASSQRTQYLSQADMAEVNARIAERGAQQELRRGEQEVGMLTLQAGQLKGRQRAVMAANGIDLSVGSAQETLDTTDLYKNVDVTTATVNAINSAWGRRSEATNYRMQALMARTNAKTANPWGSAFTSLLGSAGNVAKSWYAYSQTRTGVAPQQAPAPVSDASITFTNNRNDDPVWGWGSLNDIW